MATAVLNELQDRLHTCAVSGISAIQEDFRLKRTLERFEEISKASPVLERISGRVWTLLSPGLSDEERVSVLAEAIALTDAVVITQAEYKKIRGETENIENIGLSEGRRVYASKYSELAPLIAALTSKGSGRYEIIKRAVDEKSPALYDFRLKPALIAALGDSYSEISEMTAEFLQNEDAALIPFLKKGFDKKGKREMARRVRIITKIAGAGENDFYLSLLEGADNTVKEEAVRALGCGNINADILIRLAKTERGNIKKTAVAALSSLTTPEAERCTAEILRENPVQFLPYVRMSTSGEVSDMIADMLSEISGELLKIRRGDYPSEEQCSLVRELVFAVTNKTSPKMAQTLQKLAENEKALSKVKNIAGVSPLHKYRHGEYYEDNPFRACINEALITGLVMGNGEDMIRFAKNLSAGYPAAGLIAELLGENEKSFSKYGKHIGNETVFALRCVKFSEKTNDYRISVSAETSSGNFETFERKIAGGMDIRWIEELAKDKYSKMRVLPVLFNLINPSDEKSLKILHRYFLKQYENGGDNAVSALKKCGHENFKGMIPKYFRSRGSTSYYEVIQAYSTAGLPAETEIAEIEKIISLIEGGKIKTRSMYTVRHLTDYTERIKNGEDV